MDAPVLVAIITAVAGLVASALTFFLTKKKEREAEWRKQKLDHYKEFMAALNDIVGPPAPVGATVRFASAANNIFRFSCCAGRPTGILGRDCRIEHESEQ